MVKIIADISKWQGDIDFVRAREEGGLEEVQIRCTLGATGVDERYAQNWRESAWAGIPKRCQYHYVITGTTALGQFNNIMRVTGGDFGNAKFTVDVERMSSERLPGAYPNGFPKVAYTNMLYDLCNRLRDVVPLGVRIYSNKPEIEIMTTQASWMAEFGFHGAGYPFDPNNMAYQLAVPRPWTNWERHQFTATSHIPGFAGYVDQSRDRITTPLPPPPPTPPPPVPLGDVGRAIGLIDQARASLEELI